MSQRLERQTCTEISGRFNRDMPIEWKPLLDGIIALLRQIGNMQQRDEQQRNLALMAVLTAANQTRGYIAATQRGKPQDIEREHALSNLWETCSFALQPFDFDVSRRCRLKGEYWRDPDQWSEEDIAETRIGLERVAREAEYLLRLRVRPVRP
ncbi:MAG TPA: hypothetical protein VGF13_06610 [Verrucomicrobiae bacterium]|jgi:hypothetical protein